MTFETFFAYFLGASILVYILKSIFWILVMAVFAKSEK